MTRITNIHRWHRMVLVFGAGALLVLLAASVALGQEPQGAPNNINVQGKLAASGGGPVTAGNYTFGFKIFDAAAGGTQIWPAGGLSEDHIIALGSDGLWNATLGKDGGLDVGTMDDTTRWLEVTVTPQDGSPETFARVKLTANPFTLEAGQLNGKTGAEYVEVAGDVMTGWLSFDFGNNGAVEAELVEGTAGGTSGGILRLYDNNELTAALNGDAAVGGIVNLRKNNLLAASIVFLQYFVSQSYPRRRRSAAE